MSYKKAPSSCRMAEKTEDQDLIRRIGKLQRRLGSQLWQVCYTKVQVLVGKECNTELVILDKLISFYMGYHINRLGKTMQTYTYIKCLFLCIEWRNTVNVIHSVNS